MPNLKAYLQNCIDSFFNKSSNRQLMSAAAYPSSSNRITVVSGFNTPNGWAIVTTYTAPSDGVITFIANEGIGDYTCFSQINTSCFTASSFVPPTNTSFGNQISAIVRKGEQVRVDASRATNGTVYFYPSQGSV